MRRLGARDPQAMGAIALALGVWRDADRESDAPQFAASELERVFGSIGMPVDLAQLGIPKSSAGKILASALRNFNADPKQEFAQEEELLREVLDAAWK